MGNPVFIELTNREGKPVWVNMNRVLFFEEAGAVYGSRLTMNIPNTALIVREPPQEVAKLLKKVEDHG